MKVIEIISEGEGEYKLGARILDWGITKLGFRGKEMAFMKTLSSELADAKIAASKAGIDPASIGVKDLPSATRRLVQNSPYVAKDATLIPKAEKLAQEVAEKEGSWLRKVTGTRPSDKAAKVASGAEEAGSVLGNSLNLIYKAYVAWGFTEATVGAWHNYYQNMTIAEEHLNWPSATEKDEDGEVIKWTQSQYDEYQQTQLSILATRLAACIPTIGLAVTGRVLGVFSNLRILGPLAKIAQGFEKAGQVAYITFLNSDFAKKWLAYASLWQLNIDIPGVISFHGNPFSKLIGGGLQEILNSLKSGMPGVYKALDAVGGAVNSAINKVKPEFGTVPSGEQPADSSAQAANGGTSGADKDATSQKDAKEKDAAGSNTGRWPGGPPGKNPDWVDMGLGKWRNSKTGDIVLY